MKNFLIGLCLVCVAGGNIKAEGVQSVLARMDKEAPSFHSLSADMVLNTYTAVLKDTTKEIGTLKVQRQPGPGKLRAIMDFTAGSDARTIAFLGKVVEIYYPNLKQVDEYPVGKNTDVLNQFLLLGFGSSGKELQESYEVTAEGTEKVAGQDATKLLLVPKDKKLLDRLQRAEIWIPADSATPVQQQFYEPSGNYRQVTYSNIVRNPQFQGTLELKVPAGTSKQKH